MKFGTYIRTFRKRKGLYQNELAYKTMITPQYLNDLEGNRREPSDAVLLRLSDALGFSSDYAFYLVDKIPPDLRNTALKTQVSKAFKILRSNTHKKPSNKASDTSITPTTAQVPRI